MKIAVYAIAKNEEKFAERWLHSCLDADYIVVADTGSADNTVKEFERLQVDFSFDVPLSLHHISISPWIRNAVRP